MQNTVPNQVTLPHQLTEQMLEHALANPGFEVCGLISGHDNQPVTVYPVKNIADDPAHRFLMNPAEQIAAMRRMREANEPLWGIYHSHPDTPAEPSETDLKLAAYPDVYYFIISLAGRTPELGCFHFDGTAFSKVDVSAIQ
ncbi:MAG: Mov34/MPN/PAD-1 family protein [Gammaproteobacteria bacterium]|nr:Mov34/MPN/PAD-1 family protein [Gammaproteobacteria bacterium]